MRRFIGKRVIAALLAILLAFSVIPDYASAEENPSASGTETAGTESNEETSKPERSGETSETESSGETQEKAREDNTLTEVPETEPVQYEVTLDLDGGTINGLANAGWTKDDTNSSRWSRRVTAGETVFLSDPYRAGYEFRGWSVTKGEEAAETAGERSFTIEEDTAIQAQWTEAQYMVRFTGGGADQADPLWSVSVPYGATLWTGDEQQLTEIKEDAWESDPETAGTATATATIRLGDQDYMDVEVTRHSQNQTENPGWQVYYYTFTIDGTKYFTYGGIAPEKRGYTFAAWKKTSGGNGFHVTENETEFTAQYQAGESYTFYVYYQYADHTRVEGMSTVSETFVAEDIQDGKLTFSVPVEKLSHYDAEFASDQAGITIQADEGETDTYQVTVEVDTVFGSDAEGAVNHSCSLTVVYQPATITYTVEYYQQNVGAGKEDADYTLAGTTAEKTGAYHSLVTIQDKPADLTGQDGTEVKFDGFQAADRSLASIRGGVVLDDSVVDKDQDTATIKIYYDRAYYDIYLLTDTTETTYDPVRAQYGAAIPELAAEEKTPTRQGYTFSGYKFYQLDEKGELEPCSEAVSAGSPMPAHDLYAVAQWKPGQTTIQIQYWVEARNASSYQNAGSRTIEAIQTGEDITVQLAGEPELSAAGKTDLKNEIENGFREIIQTKYEDASYTDYFSYSEEQTRKSPGNVKAAKQNGNNQVEETEDGESQIAGDSYTIEAAGDGTTVINVYYDRNLYTLEFVIGRSSGDEKGDLVATGTESTSPDAELHSTWSYLNAAIQFQGFDTDKVTEQEAADSQKQYGTMAVQTIYHIKEAQDRDERSAVGRYGTREYDGKTYYVYTLTARFEADISSLWPTANAIGSVQGNYSYISMGPAMDSYYRDNTVSQHNILGEYATMDSAIILCGSKGNWSAKPDNEEAGTITHQMVAYWNNAKVFDYYFLYEVLDTTVSADDSSIPEFDAKRADAAVGGSGAEGDAYTDGQLVKRDGKVYRFSTERTIQRSTNTSKGQNQPAKQGFQTAGDASYTGEDTAEGAAENAGKGSRKPIYFFYDRETYTLNLYNITSNYIPSANLLTHTFQDLTYYDGESGKQVTGDVSLAQLGWKSIDTGTGNITILYNGALDVLNTDAVKDWLTTQSDDNQNLLEYPFPSMGTTGYYFQDWFHDLSLSTRFDWTANDMKGIKSNLTVYAGYIPPRYSTSYALNGGTWQDEVGHTVMRATLKVNDNSEEDVNVFLYFDHQAEDGNSPVYWYEKTSEDDLYVDTLYKGKLEDLMQQGEEGHWYLKSEITSIDQLKKYTEETQETGDLTDAYICYMQYQAGGEPDLSQSHQYYVTIIKEVGELLEKPTDPVRNGYRFAGWYWFKNTEDSGGSKNDKVYLKDVLGSGQSLSSYGEGYIYLDNVGSAYLLHEEENGELYYDKSQPGYRFNYDHQASLVDQDRELYAAWESTSDTSAKVYHLVKQDDIDGIASMQPADGASVDVDMTKTMTINGETYVVLDTEKRENLYTGTTLELKAKEYYTDDNSQVWIPTLAEQSMEISERTPTGKEQDGSVTFEGDGQAYRLEQENGAYQYFAYFLYGKTDEVSYDVYAIDLQEAVATGALDSYSDVFARDAEIAKDAGYVLNTQTRTHILDDESGVSATVTENAPEISGYVVYQDWTQTLQLQTAQGTNQIFFYYIKDGSIVHYNVTYHLMTGGKYTSGNTVEITDIPAVAGEEIQISHMLDTYAELAELAYRIDGYQGSSNPGQQALFERYKDMTITSKIDGADGTFTVGGDNNTLTEDAIRKLIEDYALDSWTPVGDTAVISDGASIDVYLQNARIRIRKVDAADQPLQGAEFTLERLIQVPETGAPAGAEIVTVDGAQYYVDEAFTGHSATTGADGETVFYDLSARPDTYVYRLKETKAPDGYGQLKEPVILKAPYQDGDGSWYYELTYTVQNSGITWLPKTGVFGGVYRQLFFGGAILMTAVVLLYQRSCHRKRKTEGKETRL